MRNSILLFCMSLLLMVSCSDKAVNSEFENPNSSTRMPDCTMILSDPDIVDDCDLFEDIFLVDNEIHIDLNTGLFSDFSECMDATWVYDPTNSLKWKSPLCGERDSYQLYCTDPTSHSIVVELDDLEVGDYNLDLCLLSECLEMIDLMDDCANDTGAQTYGTFCFKLSITCI